MSLTVLDDFVLALSVAVSTGCVVVLLAFLARYRTLTSDAAKSSQLAKNIWDAVNSRLSVMDARIIDIMAKVEIYSTRSGSAGGPGPVVNRERDTQGAGDRVESVHISPRPRVSRVSEPLEGESGREGKQEIEVRILRSLAEGPKKSNEIKAVIDRSREHTARLMKILFERGLVARNDESKPFVYEITEAGRRYLES